MPKFRVPIVGPDGTAGSIEVNASDEAAAVENASSQGGNTATGGATMIDSGPNAQTSSQNMTAGAGNNGQTGPYNSGGPATTGKTSANPGTMFGFKTNANGGKGEDRTRAIYEFRDGENLTDWMSRVFQQGTRDFGGTLSPDSSNPYSRTPYASWFQRRYSDVVPANQLLSMILNNSGGEQDYAPMTEQSMKDFIANGTGRGFGTGTAGASENLGKLGDLLTSFGDKNTGNLSPDQVAMLGGLFDDPRAQMALFNAQISGGMGANPLASKYVNQLGAQMLDEYYDDPVGRDPATNGVFLNNFRKRLNMSQ
jgi:hypothetical protein